MNTKPSMKYRVVGGRNPQTGSPLFRPVVTDRETMYLDQVVQYALNAGYVRGQFHDMRGALNGFIEAIQQLGRDGKAVNLNNWLRIHAELTGTVGENRQLTERNEMNVNITALNDLKCDWRDFSWTNVDDTGAIPKIDTILSLGGKPSELIKSKSIRLTGKNLYFDAEMGDTVTISWIEDEEEKTAMAIPSESDYSHMLLPWPEELSDVEAGTKITFTLRTHAGIEDGALQTASKTAVIKE